MRFLRGPEGSELPPNLFAVLPSKEFPPNASSSTTSSEDETAGESKITPFWVYAGDAETVAAFENCLSDTGTQYGGGSKRFSPTFSFLERIQQEEYL